MFRFMRTLTIAIGLPLAAVGETAQTLSDRHVAANGTTIRLRCGGERRPGSPLVVLEAGAFNTVDTWRDVHAPIAAFARACAHDRPGRGDSGAAPAGLDGRGYITLLAKALRSAGEAPPYLLVGHSLGGVIAQLFVARRPNDVAAMVLVDSSHPDQVRRLADLPRPSTSAPAAPSVAMSPRPEAVSLEAFASALRHAPPPIGVPLVVLSRSRWTNGVDGSAELAWLARWQEMQRDLAGHAGIVRHEIVAGSGHYVQNDAPAAVVAAVRRLLQR
jgi:pimeloyl-ACP methyl ester carboxylesterase